MQSRWYQGDWPVTQPYGCTDFAGEGYNPNHPECPYFHEGIDLGLPYGQIVFAGLDCECVLIGAYGYGEHAVVVRVANWDVWLGHGFQNYVNVGDQISAGMPLMAVNSEGFSTGDHLHFEVRPAGAPYRSSVDPTFMLEGNAPLVASRPRLLSAQPWGSLALSSGAIYPVGVK